MSDFLNNLIGRSYGLKPVAEPRLASRFEPVQGDVLTNQEAALESEEFLTGRNETQPRAVLANAAHETVAAQSIEKSRSEEEPPHDSSQTAGRALTRSNADEARQPVAEVSFEAEDSSPKDAAVSAPLQTAASLDNQTQASQERDLPRAGQTPPSPSLEEQEGVDVAANRERGSERESLAPLEQHDSNAQAERSLKDSSITSVEQPASNASSIGQREGELSRRSVAPARVAAQSSASEMLEQSSPLSVESHFGGAAESAQPTIRVTIGRIDVRAVMPDSKQTPRAAAASSAPARKAHGPLSLEEYLKQRNGGER